MSASAWPRLWLAGCGYVARRLLQRPPPPGLAAAMHAHARRAHPALGALAAPCIAWDLDSDTPPAETPDLDGAAVVYSIAPGGEGERDLRLARWLAAVRGDPRRLVYLGTTGVYGDRAGAVCDELTPPAPTQARSRRRVDAERQLTQWCAARGAELTILRLPAIYGPDRLPLERLRRGDPVPDRAPPGFRIHVDDLVDAVLAALAPGAPPGTYLVLDDSALSLPEWFDLVAGLAGLARPPRLAPDEAARRLPAAMLSFYAEDRRLDDRRSRAQLGLTPRYADPADGVRASLAEMGVDAAR